MSLLSTLTTMYVATMTQDIRSPIPLIVGPPGVGKSTSAFQLAEMMGVNCHVLNLARSNPVEMEGILMPITTDEGMETKLLPSHTWTQIQPGDVLIIEEPDRAMKFAMDAVMDILTSRRVAGEDVAPCFAMAAANSTKFKDMAHADRFLPVPVEDVRRKMGARNELKQLLVNALGLHPDVVDSHEMEMLITEEVDPTYEILDELKTVNTGIPASVTGTSVRNLMGQVRLRQIQSVALEALVKFSNEIAVSKAQWHYYIMLAGKPPADFVQVLPIMIANPKILDPGSVHYSVQLTNSKLLNVRQALKPKETP